MVDITSPPHPLPHTPTMSVIVAASVASHTTASAPRPHILYNVQVKTADGKASTVSKRYSDVCPAVRC